MVSWSKSELAEYELRTRKRNPVCPVQASQPKPTAPQALDCHGQKLKDRKSGVAYRAASTDEQKLNKTELSYLHFLRAGNIKWIGIQNITLKLAHDCRLTVDFVTLNDGWLTFIDVKGFQREDALIKMRIAARLFPFWNFHIVTKTSSGWHVSEIKP